MVQALWPTVKQTAQGIRATVIEHGAHVFQDVGDRAETWADRKVAYGIAKDYQRKANRLRRAVTV